MGLHTDNNSFNQLLILILIMIYLFSTNMQILNTVSKHFIFFPLCVIKVNFDYIFDVEVLKYLSGMAVFYLFGRNCRF